MELVEAFLGNETIKQRLTNALAKDQLSHCYLLCGPAGSGKHVLARYITAIMECTGAHKPCGRCPQCHKGQMVVTHRQRFRAPDGRMMMRVTRQCSRCGYTELVDEDDEDDDHHTGMLAGFPFLFMGGGHGHGGGGGFGGGSFGGGSFGGGGSGGRF